MSNRNKSIRKTISKTPTDSVVRSPPLSMLAGATFIAVVVWIAYLPSINGGFVLDDDQLLTKNEFIKSYAGLYHFWFTLEPADYWPVSNTTLWIEWRLWGMHPTGYHLTNLILHIAESLLIWIILRKLSISGAFLAALIFAVHPVNVESVAWISQRKNMVAMLFFLLSILWYLKHLCIGHAPHADRAVCSRHTPCADSKHGSRNIYPDFWYFLSLAAFILAMLSKGSVAVLPMLLLGIVWWQRTVTRRDLLQIIPFFIIAAILTAVNVWFQTHGSGEAIRPEVFGQRLLGAGGVVWFYLYKALWPVDLAFVYPQWHIELNNLKWWLPLLAAVLITAMLWLYRESWARPVLLAWGFFCMALVPVMGFTDVGFMRFSLVADRYQHVAIIGLIALGSAGWSVLHKRLQGTAQLAAIFVVMAIVVSFISLTRQQSGLYSDAVTLYKAAIEANHNCWLAYNNLGTAYFNAGQVQKAVEQYDQALQIKPEYAEAHYNLGVLLDQTGHPTEAIEHYRQALYYKPDYADAHNNLSFVLAQSGQVDEAIEHSERAVQINPDFAEAHNNLAVELIQKRLPQEAIEHCEKALHLKPDYPDAHYNLGLALVKTGRPKEAIREYRQALKLKPNYPEAHYNLANILSKTDRTEEAIDHYRQALRLKPDYIEAHINLGSALVKSGRFQQAIDHFQQALQLKPDFAEVYYNMALAYAGMRQSAKAVEMAQKALDLAQSQRQTELHKQIEAWLNSYLKP